MRFLKQYFQKFLEYLDEQKKHIIINYIYFFIIFGVLLLIDLVTKATLFDFKKAETSALEIQHQNFLFGIRSVKNYGLTFFGEKPINMVLVNILNFILIFGCLSTPIFLKSKTFIILIAFIASGSFGNTIDRLSLGYVRDIIYIPWNDRGTFNCADCFAIIGSIGVVILLIIEYIFHFKKNNK